jgi:Domain of unknown function (DUF5615)
MAMPTIMADHDVEGHLRVLLSIWSSPTWVEVWADLSCNIQSFERLGIESDAPDEEIWRVCQEQEIVLITGNRNNESDDSLEATIRRIGTSNNLPVLTIADPDRLMKDRSYAEEVAFRVYDYLQALDYMRGSGRLFVP